MNRSTEDGYWCVWNDMMMVISVVVCVQRSGRRGVGVRNGTARLWGVNLRCDVRVQHFRGVVGHWRST